LGPPIIPLLALTGVCYFSLRASEGNDYGLQSPIDFRHFSGLQTVELGLGRCVASLDLALLQSTEVISIPDHSDFPVAALKKFLNVGSKRHLPLLRNMELDIMNSNTTTKSNAVLTTNNLVSIATQKKPFSHTRVGASPLAATA